MGGLGGIMRLLALGAVLAGAAGAVSAQERVPDLPGGNPTFSNPETPKTSASNGMPSIPDLTKRENLSSALQLIILLTVLSLAPAILIMMTSFTRIVIVMSLLRQALGTQQLPPNQILVGLSLFMTFVVMGPTWQRVNNEALQPYMNGTLDQSTALTL